MATEVLTDPEIDANARREGRLVGDIGESFAHTTGDGDDTSGNVMEIGFKGPREWAIDVQFKAIMDQAFPIGEEPIHGDLFPDTPLEFRPQ